MKKFFTLNLNRFIAVVAISIITFSCSSDFSASGPYLSIDPKMSADSPENAAVIRKAIERMDRYVTFEDGQYFLNNATAAKLAMSDELFAELHSIMQLTNKMLSDAPSKFRLVEIESKTIVLVDTEKQSSLSLLRTRKAGENPGSGGETSVEIEWYGLDINLSKQALDDIRLAGEGLTAIAGIAGLTGIGAPEATYLAIAGAIAGFAAGVAERVCPDGITVSVYWTVIIPYISNASYSASCQD